MINEYNKEQIKDNLKTILGLEWFGIRIEDTKEMSEPYGIATKTIYYYSVPETSTIEIEDVEVNKRIKTADGLKLIAKETLTGILIDTFKSIYPDDDELIEEITTNMSDYFKFYAKVRKGEVWNKELGDNRVKELCEEIQNANEYKEI
jgi:hypothetical protein